MQIECRFNCEAGRVIEFDGPAGPRSIAYKFGPGRGPWVVEVTDPEHLGAMLASPQKFRVVVEAGRGRALPKPTAAPDPGETDPAALGINDGSDVFSAFFFYFNFGGFFIVPPNAGNFICFLRNCGNRIKPQKY